MEQSISAAKFESVRVVSMFACGMRLVYCDTFSHSFFTLVLQRLPEATGWRNDSERKIRWCMNRVISQLIKTRGSDRLSPGMERD
jgi:hypothetical protein